MLDSPKIVKTFPKKKKMEMFEKERDTRQNQPTNQPTTFK